MMVEMCWKRRENTMMMRMIDDEDTHILHGSAGWRMADGDSDERFRGDGGMLFSGFHQLTADRKREADYFIASLDETITRSSRCHHNFPLRLSSSNVPVHPYCRS
jgi:hypothetical protein